MYNWKDTRNYRRFRDETAMSLPTSFTLTARKSPFQMKFMKPNQPEIVPEEAAIVERIYEMFLAGQPVKVIAQTLQAEKMRSPERISASART